MSEQIEKDKIEKEQIEKDKIYNCDCLEGMKHIPNASIDLVVTSPPYDNLRQYGGAAEDWNFDKFTQIAQQLTRVLKDGGVIIWVVGDATADGSESLTSFKQAIYFREECGLNLYDTMLYMKANPLPQTQRRYEQVFEYMFAFSKGMPAAFNPIRVTSKRAGEYQQWGRDINTDERTAKYLRKDDVRKTNETKIHGNAFVYGIGGNPTGHPAVFPQQLALDQVFTWSNEGDTVLDPFMGSGTTAVACIKEKRHFIGFELNKQYYDKACQRIDAERRQLSLF